MDLAPIVLFTFNRPNHLKQTLEGLLMNDLASKSILYIFCDGRKENASFSNLEKIKETRTIAKSKKWCKEVHIIENETNKGLANSIIDGVTEVINKYGKIIVLEDDIVPSIGFLKYMNEALILYENEEKVGCVHAWNYVLNYKNYKKSTFFLKGADCWGWATWKRSWDLFEKSGQKLLAEIQQKKLEYSFDRNGTHSFVAMLKDQIEKKNDSWAIRWHASLFLQNKLCLQPTVSIVENIGLDGSGVHCGTTNLTQKTVEYIKLKKDNNPQESVWFYQNYNRTMRRGYSKFFMVNKIKSRLKNYIFRAKKNRNITTKVSNSEMWFGDFLNWEDAAKNCTGYNEDLILDKCKNSLLKIKNNEAVYERDSVIFDEIQYSWGLLAGLQKAALENDGQLSVIDFGGSLGSTYFQNKSFLASLKNLEWSIVEQENFVACGKLNFETNQLHFYNTINECVLHQQPNVLILSSVLQYLENPEKWTNTFLSYNFDYIIIDRTSFINDKLKRLTIQNVPESIYKASYPAWFFNEEEFLIKFLLQYKLLAKFDSGITGSCFLEDNVKAYWSGFILKKI